MFAFCGLYAAWFPPQFPAMTIRIVALIDLRPVAATGIPLGDVVIVLAFVVAAAAVASTFVGEGVGICSIVALLRESWV